MTAQIAAPHRVFFQSQRGVPGSIYFDNGSALLTARGWLPNESAWVAAAIWRTNLPRCLLDNPSSRAGQIS